MILTVLLPSANLPEPLLRDGLFKKLLKAIHLKEVVTSILLFSSHSSRGNLIKIVRAEKKRGKMHTHNQATLQ